MWGFWCALDLIRFVIMHLWECISVIVSINWVINLWVESQMTQLFSEWLHCFSTLFRLAFLQSTPNTFLDHSFPLSSHSPQIVLSFYSIIPPQIHCVKVLVACLHVFTVGHYCVLDCSSLVCVMHLEHCGSSFRCCTVTQTVPHGRCSEMFFDYGTHFHRCMNRFNGVHSDKLCITWYYIIYVRTSWSQ